MKEELSKLSTEAIKEIIELMKSTKDFTMEQMPILCKEIVQWGRCECIIHLLITIVSAIVLREMKKRTESLILGQQNEATIILIIVILIFASIFFISGVCNFIFYLKAFITPKLYIISYLVK